MNERIQKLLKVAIEDIPRGYNPGTGYYVPGEFFEKFAELIVEECARIVINNGIATATHDQMVRQDCVNEIKQHFGVEL